MIPMLIFFFNDPPPTEIYTLSLHDALPICGPRDREGAGRPLHRGRDDHRLRPHGKDVIISDRKSTRLNSSHRTISYAVFCLKKKKDITGFGTPRVEATRSPHSAEIRLTVAG